MKQISISKIQKRIYITIVILPFVLFVQGQTIFENSKLGTNGPFGTNITCIDVAKSKPEMVYIGTLGNGVYRTGDSGLTWQHCSTNGFPEFTDSVNISVTQDCWWNGSFYPITALTVSPGNEEHLYIAIKLNGIFESEDGGTSWTKISGTIPDSTCYSKIWIDEDNTDIIYLAAGRFVGNGGLYKTPDAGKTWQVIDQLPHGQSAIITDFIKDPDNNNHLFAGIGNNGSEEFQWGLMESNDKGETWTIINQLTAFYDIAIDNNDSKHLLAILYNGWGNWFLGESTDGGKNWDNKLPEENIWCTSLYKDQQGCLYLTKGTGKQTLFLSKDFGTTWAIIDSIDSWYAFNAARQIRAGNWGYYCGNTFGFYCAVQPESPKELRNNNIKNTYIYRLANDPRNEKVIYATGQQGFYKSTDGANTWQQLADWTAHAVTVDPRHPDTIYFGGTSLKRSFDGGKTITDIYNINMGIVEDIVVNPKQTNIIYCRTMDIKNLLCKSEDFGENWILLNAWEDAGTLAIDPQHPDTVYCGTYRSVDGGANWVDIAKNVVAVHPENPNILYALYRGQLSYSNDWATTWQVLDEYTSFPAAATYRNHFYFNPDNDKYLYYTVAHGIRYSTNGGLTWQWLEGPFDSRVLDIIAIPEKEIFYLATFGQGVWAYGLQSSVNERIRPCGTGYDKLIAYPNPFANCLIIELPVAAPDNSVLEVYNLSGQLIYCSPVKKGATILKWEGINQNGQKSQSGFYIIKYVSGNKTMSTRIFKH